MSRGSKAPSLIVEWSPDGVLVYDPMAKTQTRYASISEASAVLGAGQVVRVAVSRRTSFIRTVRVPDAPKADVLQALRLTAGGMLPLPAAEVAFDVRLVNEVTLEGRTAVLAAVRSEDLKTLQTEIKAANWKVSEIMPAAFGSMILAQRLGQQDCTIVQETGEGWTLDVIHKNELRYSRALPNNVPVANLEDEVARTYAAAGLPCGPVVAAAGLSLPIAQLRTDYSSLECLATPQADLIGIHLQLIEDVLERLATQHRSKLRLAGAAALIAVLLAAYAVSDRASAQARLDAQKAKWAKSDQDLAKRKSAAQTDESAATAKNRDLDLAFKPAQRMSDIMTIVSNAAPEGVWLTGLGIERGKPVMIRGTATTSEAVAAFVKALSTSDRLRTVQLVFANNGAIEQRPVVEFSVSAIAIGNLPLINYAQVKSK